MRLADHEVNRVGYGALQIPGPNVFGEPVDPDSAVAVLRRALELGVNHIDTAYFYGPEVANRYIRAALHPYPDDLLIATKIGGRRDSKGAWIPAEHPVELRAGIEDNLRTLGVERLDLVYIGSQVQIPLEDQMAELQTAQAAGKIAAVGISNATVASLHEALGLTDVAAVQNRFSLFERDQAPVLDECARRGIPFVPYFSLGSAMPGKEKADQDAVVRAVAGRHNTSASSVALAWQLKRYPISLVIPGTKNPTHLAENMAAQDLQLTEADLQELDVLTADRRA